MSNQTSNSKSISAKSKAKVQASISEPYSYEAEQAVLGSIIRNNQFWEAISDCITRPEDFYIHAHKLIFQAMKELFDNNQPVDILTIEEVLKNKSLQDQMGGFAYLAELANSTPLLPNIRAYAEIVRDNAILREILGVTQKIAENCYDRQGQEVKDILDNAEKQIFNIAEQRTSSEDGPKSIEKVLDLTVDRIEALSKAGNNSGITGVSTGFTDLDRKTAGFQSSDLIVIAARPSMGKTTFAMNLCENIALNSEKPVLIFSLEMPAEQIMMRVLASLSRVDQTKIRTGNLDEQDFSKLSQTMGILKDRKNMYIDDSSGLTPTELRSRARRIYRENGGLSLIMVDYLQLMRVHGFSENRNLEISEISRSLKALAKELSVPVVALSQLNRSLESRTNKRPINSDLRESGAIEQDADVIMFIYRDEVYNENSESKGIAEIIIGKQRNGPIGTVKLSFLGQFSRFDNLALTPEYMESHY